MSLTVNSQIVLGNVGQEPKLRETKSGIKVMEFSVATTESHKDDSGGWKEETDWHGVVLWKPSDFIISSLKSGTKVYVEGRVKRETYEDKDGKKASSTKIIARRVLILSGKDSNSQKQEPEPNLQTEKDDDLPF